MLHHRRHQPFVRGSRAALVACAVPSPHIRVVAGLDGALVHLNDPAPVNTGARYNRRFAQFFGAMENLGAQEINDFSPVYVAHLTS